MTKNEWVGYQAIIHSRQLFPLRKIVKTNGLLIHSPVMSTRLQTRNNTYIFLFNSPMNCRREDLEIRKRRTGSQCRYFKTNEPVSGRTSDLISEGELIFNNQIRQCPKQHSLTMCCDYRDRTPFPDRFAETSWGVLCMGRILFCSGVYDLFKWNWLMAGFLCKRKRYWGVWGLGKVFTKILLDRARVPDWNKYSVVTLKYFVVKSLFDV